MHIGHTVHINIFMTKLVYSFFRHKYFGSRSDNTVYTVDMDRTN